MCILINQMLVFNAFTEAKYLITFITYIKSTLTLYEIYMYSLSRESLSDYGNICTTNNRSEKD